MRLKCFNHGSDGIATKCVDVSHDVKGASNGFLTAVESSYIIFRPRQKRQTLDLPLKINNLAARAKETVFLGVILDEYRRTVISVILDEYGVQLSV